MRKRLFFAALVAGAFASAPGRASVTMGFEGIGTYGINSGIGVQTFYNGGTASNGASGPNLGVSLSSNAVTLCLNTPGTVCSTASRGGQGNPTSAFTGLVFLTGTQIVLNDAAGFTTGMFFYYADHTTPGFVSIFDGLNGSGNLLATLALGVNASGCGAPYNAAYCPFGLANLPFAGTAHSVVIGGPANHLVLDDITLGAVALPEPMTWAMMLLGFGACGMALRRRRRPAVA